MCIKSPGPYTLNQTEATTLAVLSIQPLLTPDCGGLGYVLQYVLRGTYPFNDYLLSEPNQKCLLKIDYGYKNRSITPRQPLLSLLSDSSLPRGVVTRDSIYPVFPCWVQEVPWAKLQV
jgi:hypothetical protein